MEYALPSSWSQGSRGFWTKRKKSATSIVAILALIAGIAVAFKLFDRTVPNNVVRDASIFDFDVLVRRSASQGCTAPVQGGTYCDTLQDQPNNPIFAGTEFVNGVERPKSQFPGDTRREEVRIVNANRNPAKDATFEMFIHNISVSRCQDFDGSGAATPADLSDDASAGDFDPETGECLGGTEAVAPASTDATRFINFFTLSVDAQQYLVVNEPTGIASGEEPVPAPFNYAEVCAGGIREITKNSPCSLGTVRASGSESLITGAPTDQRDYRFDMHEEDDGTDQSRFKGWFVTFDMTFSARLPALPDSSAPVSQR